MKHINRRSAPLLVVFSLGLLPACGVLERWACGQPEDDCDIPPQQALGSPQDATLAGTADERATISEVEFCEIVGDHETNMVHISTHGSDVDPDFAAWLEDRVLPELRARDVSPGRGLVPCPHPRDDDDVSYGFTTSDWADVDPIVEVIRQVATEDDIAVDVSIAVEPVIIDCADADESCGA